MELRTLLGNPPVHISWADWYVKHWLESQRAGGTQKRSEYSSTPYLELFCENLAQELYTTQTVNDLRTITSSS